MEDTLEAPAASEGAAVAQSPTTRGTRAVRRQQGRRKVRDAAPRARG